MIYYWFNKQEILQKAKEKYYKEKASEYYKQNKEAIKEKSKEHYKNLSQEEKTRLKSINTPHPLPPEKTRFASIKKRSAKK